MSEKLPRSTRIGMAVKRGLLAWLTLLAIAGLAILILSAGHCS